MRKILYIYSFLLIFLLSSCQSVEIVSISEKQTQVSDIRDYILMQSINNLDTTSFSKLSLNQIIGESYANLDLQRNEIPYLNSNLISFKAQIQKAYIKSLFEIQTVLKIYAKKIKYPLLYPNVNNKYIINKKSSTVLFEQYRDELYLEIEIILDKNLTDIHSLYTQMAKEYNIYCNGLQNLNRQSPPLISTNILPRMKTIFIKTLLTELSNNELDLQLINIEIDPTKININKTGN